MKRPFTGRHMAMIMIAFFGVVVVVNFYMASVAGSTFGGVVVENSYVASQKFNRWLEEAEAEKALGWTAETTRRPDGRVTVVLAGVPAGRNAVQGTARHPLGRMADQPLTFSSLDGREYVSDAPLPQGRWRVRIVVNAAGKTMRTEQDVL